VEPYLFSACVGWIGINLRMPFSYLHNTLASSLRLSEPSITVLVGMCLFGHKARAGHKWGTLGPVTLFLSSPIEGRGFLF
jgi:hypothetical protein